MSKQARPGLKSVQKTPERDSPNEGMARTSDKHRAIKTVRPRTGRGLRSRAKGGIPPSSYTCTGATVLNAGIMIVKLGSGRGEPEKAGKSYVL